MVAGRVLAARDRAAVRLASVGHRMNAAVPGPVLRRDLWALFHRLAASGTSLLVSSHVMDEATRCHTLVLLREGRILAAEAPDELLRRTGQPDGESAFLYLIDNDPLAPASTTAVEA